MKITLYTITDCPFSKQEKEYLSSHTLTFEEKNLETNREFLTEMLAVSNNFAGTPVTKVEKDDGQIAILKGFTKEEFDKLLGFTAEPAKPASTEPSRSVEPVSAPTPAPVVETPPVTVESVPTPTPPPAPVVETPPTAPPAAPVQPVAPDVSAEASAKADPLANVLSSLEQQVNAVPTKQEEPIKPTPSGTDSTASTVQPPAMPTIPDPQL